MARRSTPTFIVELPLVVSARDEREMLVRLELARQLSNACLGEALRRLDLMRESLAYERARAMPKMAGKKPNKERASAFAALRHTYGFTSDFISAFGTQCKNEAHWNEGRSRTDPRLGAHESKRSANPSIPPKLKLRTLRPLRLAARRWAWIENGWSGVWSRCRPTGPRA